MCTDGETKTLDGGEGQSDPGLSRKGLCSNKNELNWIRTSLAMQPGDRQKLKVRIRYRQPLQKANLYMREEGLYIIFDEVQRGITAGQFAACYNGDELLGSGVIAE